MPQYGEYAPAGQVSPATPVAPAAPANPYGVPGYAAPATPSNTYGVPAAPGAPAHEPPTRKRRTWDVVLTSILLVLGLLGTGLALLYAFIFANPELLDQTMQSQGFGGFSGDVGNSPAILAISHILLFVVAAALSIVLLVRGRIVVFWIPLAAGVIAAIIFWSTVISVILSDPSFVQNYAG